MFRQSVPEDDNGSAKAMGSKAEGSADPAKAQTTPEPIAPGQSPTDTIAMDVDSIAPDAVAQETRVTRSTPPVQGETEAAASAAEGEEENKPKEIDTKAKAILTEPWHVVTPPWPSPPFLALPRSIEGGQQSRGWMDMLSQ